MTLSLIGGNAALVLVLMTALWVVSIRKADVSIVDPWWSINFLLIAIHTLVRTGPTPARLLLVGAVAIWALRLWGYLLLRARGQPEDPRYQAFRQRFGPDRYWWFSFFQVFLLQGALALVISAPLQRALTSPAPLSTWDMAGILLFALGFSIEVVADRQLAAHRKGPRGRVLDSGLWRYSRHPNYFGEALLWWGFALFAIDDPYGWITLLSPLLMTYLLVEVSGVRLLDAHLARTRPGYAAYMARTSAFIPWPPRNAA